MILPYCLLDHLRHEGLRDSEDAGHVHLPQEVEILGRRFENRLAPVRAHTVHEDIDATVRSRHLGQLVNVPLVAGIAQHRDDVRVSRQRRPRCFQVFVGPTREDDLCPQLEKDLGSTLPDGAGASCDQGDLPVEGEQISEHGVPAVVALFIICL